ncbi:transposase [Streptosporangium sp. NPDC006007]|uniref:transposase n=1 Tax=Streptosporangium sp. NPDC006007 TaxID=3154575 RepID=UPI0033A32AC7
MPAGRSRAASNLPAHVARVFKGRREEPAAIGVELFYLPPRSPELNDIERVWRSAKYEDYPGRVHTTNEAIGTAVDQALNRQRAHINGSAANFTKAARHHRIGHYGSCGSGGGPRRCDVLDGMRDHGGRCTGNKSPDSSYLEAEGQFSLVGARSGVADPHRRFRPPAVVRPR